MSVDDAAALAALPLQLNSDREPHSIPGPHVCLLGLSRLIYGMAKEQYLKKCTPAEV